MRSPSVYNGVVVVDKPAGMTSHDVVDAARRLYRTRRVGHTGTLDPDATGVLVLCLGVATRLAEYLSAARKQYVTDVLFGIETDSQDVSGQVVAEHDASALTERAVLEALAGFRGTIEQTPPMVSARRHEGARLYELARSGVVVERKPGLVEIYHLALTRFGPGPRPVATLEVCCSSGTYIRTLAHDLGAALGVGAAMQTLRRTQVGDTGSGFSLNEAWTLDALRDRAESSGLVDTVLPMRAALRNWPTAALPEQQLLQLRGGQAVPLAHAAGAAGTDVSGDRPIAVLDETGEVCAVARAVEGWLRPVKVLTLQ